MTSTEELREFWDQHGRMTVTQYRDQVRHSREVYDDDRMERDEPDSVRRDESTECEGAAVRADSTGDPVSLAAARAEAADNGEAGRDAGPGGTDMGLIGEGMRAARMIERAGSYSRPQAPAAVTQDRAQEVRARLQARLAARRGLAEPDTAQAAYGPSQGDVAVREAAAVVRVREAIDGDQVLRYIYTYLRHFACWGSEAETVAATLWIAHTHARDAKGMPVWQYCARLGILGPSGSGKSWKSRLVGKLAYSGEILLEPTKPAFIDLCADKNTIIVTEADEAFRSPGRSRGIVAVINGSYEPDRKSSRKQGGVAVKIPLFTHVVLDGIDDVLLSANRPDLRALMSRCIIVLSRFAPAGYRPPRFDREARATAELLSQRASAWMAQEVQNGLEDLVPRVPEHMGNRPFALWEPLFSVALAADLGLREKASQAGEPDPGTPWSDACTDACEQLEAAPGLPEPTEDAVSELDRSMAQYGGEEL